MQTITSSSQPKRAWLRPVSLAFSAHAPKTTAWDQLGRVALWPIAALMLVHRVAIQAVNGSVTDDYTTVYQALRRFLDGVPVYNEQYSHVDPHYLYNPGATVLLSPLAMIDHVFLARTAFIAVNAIAVVIALGIFTRLFGYALRSIVWPAAVVVALCTESVQNTLTFSNINCVLFLGLAGFFWALLSERKWVAGAVIGLMILIKPVFAPLLALPFLLVWWQPIVLAIGVVAAFNAVGFAVVPGAREYLTRTVPYLGEVRDYANSSLQGMGIYFGITPWLITACFLFFAALVGIGVLALVHLRSTDPLLWASCTSSLLLTGAFFLSSLGQMYYSMMLFPLVFTILLPRHPLRSPMAWVGLFLIFSASPWISHRWPDYGWWMEQFRATAGWGILIMTIAVSALVWWSQDRRGQAAPSHRPGESIPVSPSPLSAQG